jgi:predicted HTH transcriptional regulator
MNEEDLKKLLNNLVSLLAETETVEFKENNFEKEEIGKRISSLSNSANLMDEKFAYLVFGVRDGSHEIVGTRFFPYQEKVGNMILEHWLVQRIDPKIDFRIHQFDYDGKNIVIFQIPPAINQPVEFENVAYIRIASNTTTLKQFPEKERKIWNNIHRTSFESGIAMEGVGGKKVLSLLDYSKYFSLTKQELPSDTEKFLEKLEQHKIVRKVFRDSYDITNLGAILLANNIQDFDSIKRKSVRVILYEGGTREKRNREQEGKFGYAIGFEGLIDYINDKLPFNEEITKALRKEEKMYPEVAIREFLANALIHQDFSITGSGPMIEIFDDRIEITNPGEPLIEVDRFIDHPPRSRNEDLAAFMRQIGICEESGTGIDRALIAVEIFQLPAPRFEAYDKFTRITLYAHKGLKEMTDDDRIRACYQHAVLLYVNGKKRMTNESLRNRLGISEGNYPYASKIIKQTIEKGLIRVSEKPKEYVPIWA